VLLAVEVGNTNTKIGVFEGARLLVSWRLTSRREQTADEYGVFIETLLRTRGIGPQDIRGVAISNVVPPVEAMLRSMSEKYFGIEPFSVEPGADCGLPLAVDNPREVGADRVVKSVAARALYGAPLIVIDFGTATTFDCVNARGEFIGGAIAPGLATSVDALLNRAARLYRVELVRPPTAIGRSTITNIQSGVIHGYAGLVDGLVDRMRAEMEGAPRVVATGGHAALVADATRTIEIVNPDLTLEGLRMLFERSQKAAPGESVDRH
jgi:type III pantothenate kinase